MAHQYLHASVEAQVAVAAAILAAVYVLIIFEVTFMPLLDLPVPTGTRASACWGPWVTSVLPPDQAAELSFLRSDLARSLGRRLTCAMRLLSRGSWPARWLLSGASSSALEKSKRARDFLTLSSVTPQSALEGTSVELWGTGPSSLDGRVSMPLPAPWCCVHGGDIPDGLVCLGSHRCASAFNSMKEGADTGLGGPLLI